MVALRSPFGRHLRRGASLVAAVTASVLVAAPAFADSFRHVDPARDMRWQSGLGHRTRLAPPHRNGDIRDVRVRYQTDVVTIQAHFRDLHPAKGTNGTVGIIGDIDVNPEAAAFPSVDGSHFTYSIDVTTKQPTRPEMEISDSLGAGEIFCSGEGDGLVGVVDFTGNTISLEIPRHCLHTPRWVRVSMGSFANPETKAGFSWHDVWINPWPKTRFTPRLFRG